MTAATLWARSDIRRRWRSLLGVALVAALAGGAVLSFVAGARRARDGVDRFAATTGWPDVMVWSATDVPPAIFRVLEADPSVVDHVEAHVMTAVPKGLRPGADGSALLVPDGSRYRAQLVEGHLPRPGHPEEITMSGRDAERLHIKVGNKVPFVGAPVSGLSDCLSSQSPSCATVDMGDAVLAGITRTLQDIGPRESGLTTIGRLDMLNADASVVRTNIVLVYTRSKSDITPLIGRLSTLVPQGDVTPGDTDVSAPHRIAAIEYSALLVAALLAALAGSVALAPMYGRHLARRREDALVIDALGMLPRHRFLAGWLPGLAAAAAAGAFATVVAIALSPAFPLGAARQTDLDAGLHADWLVLATGATAVVLVVAGLTAVSSWRWCRYGRTRQAVAEVGTIARLVVACALDPVPAEGARLALDAGKGPRRLPVVPTLGAAATGVAVATGALIVAASLAGLFHDGSRYGRGWDLEVTLSREDATFDAQARAVADDPRVAGALQVRAGELRVPTNKGTLEVSAVGYEPLRGGLSPTILDGRMPASPDEVMLGTDTMEHAGLHVGDLVEVSGPSSSTTAHIVGRAVLPDVGSVTSDDGVVVPMAMHRRLQSVSLVAGLDDKAAVLLRVPNAADREALRTDLEAKGYLIDQPIEPGGIVALHDIGLVASLLAIITALIVAVATGHALVTAVRRRRGELAVLRALGLRPSQVRRAVTCQAFAVVAVALAIGIPAGLIAGRLVWRIISSANRVLPIIDVPMLNIAALVAGLVAVALLMSVVPGRRAALVDPAEALRTE